MTTGGDYWVTDDSGCWIRWSCSNAWPPWCRHRGARCWRITGSSPRGPVGERPSCRRRPRPRAAGGAGLAPLALGAAPAPGVCARGPGLSALRRPAADPRGGDRAPRGPGAARRAGAGRYAAAPRCRHRPVTRRRSQRPRGRGSPALPAARPGVSAPSSGVRPAPAARAARALAGPTRGALDSGHPADAPARLPAALEGRQETGFGLPRFSARSVSYQAGVLPNGGAGCAAAGVPSQPGAACRFTCQRNVVECQDSDACENSS